MEKISPVPKCQSTPDILILLSFLHDQASQFVWAFPSLAPKAPQPGKFLSPRPTRPAGHLLLPFSVKQTKCVRPSAILGEKVITTISL